MLLLDEEKIKSLLEHRFCEDNITCLKDLPQPESLEYLMQIAQGIQKAMAQNKRIVVVGDYDVDGVVSCAILEDFFARIPYPVEIVIPNRFSDGYGLSCSIIARLHCDVIITVDNGINAIDAAKVCKERGIELFITDHHTPKETLPEALICNPKLSKNFPEPEICGACVAWYLCAALKKALGLNVVMTEFLDLLALAIVSDVMPLRGVNRVLLKKGLECLKQSSRQVFITLREHFFKHNFDAQCISYYIAPLLNCAGRMDSGMLAYAFLIAKNKMESKRLLEQLLDLNAKRKALQMSMIQEAREMFCAQENYQELPMILVYKPTWHEGIVGIIAARLCEEFFKPCIVLARKDGILKGSMRSASIDCMEVLESLKGYLSTFGGHFSAAGLSLKEEHLEGFRESLAKCQCDAVENTQLQEVLGQLPLSLVSDKLFRILQNFEPFGAGNAIPKFYSEAKVIKVRLFASKHSQIILRDFQGAECDGILFNKDLRDELGKNIACIYTLQWDKFAQKVVVHLSDYWAL